MRNKGKIDNLLNSFHRISLRREYILKTYGWHIYWITCYCPSCYGNDRDNGDYRRSLKSWKNYRKKQYIKCR